MNEIEKIISDIISDIKEWEEIVKKQEESASSISRAFEPWWHVKMEEKKIKWRG